MAVTQHGEIRKKFAVRDEDNKVRLLDEIERALSTLATAHVSAFLAFGCLLSAVREGRLVGHDNDADIVYVARASHPLDVILESFELERLFVAHGWQTTRFSGGSFKLHIRMPDRSRVGIDVFAAFYVDGHFFMLPGVEGILPRSALLPHSTVSLEGREILAPADPEALLEATYGPSWRTPEPATQFEQSRWLRRRLSGWMRGERKHRHYWDEFYANRADQVPGRPSSFAEWVSDRERGGGGVIDVGCGTGRDSLFFARQGYRAMGCDYSRPAITYSSALAKDEGLDVKFEVFNLYDLRHVLTAGARHSWDFQPSTVFARFLVHALEEDGRRNLVRFSRSALSATRGRLYLEFRTEPTEHTLGEHFPHPVVPNTVQDELTAAGFDIEHIEQGHGLAVDRNEDPRVCRIVAKRGR